ncbi:MAG: hypothetical protein J5365_08190 [Erysipelotrichaceae bacterium]|nr:hypothetical protein [Erysipelotrichaceae bacterium]
MKKHISLLLLVFLLLGCSAGSLPKETRMNEEVFLYHSVEIPSALGEPLIKEKEMQDLGRKQIYEVADSISTYADAFTYIQYQDYSSDKTPYRLVKNMVTLLQGDYDEVRAVDIFVDADAYYVLSIKANDRYYLLDPFAAYKGETKWLQSYDLEEGSFADQDSLIDAINKGYPVTPTLVLYAPIDPDGYELKVLYKSGTYIYEYKGFDFLVDYGFPLMSQEEMDALIKEVDNGNYSLAAETIRTIPDMAGFLITRDYAPSDKDSMPATSRYHKGDVGNIQYYDDSFKYTISGLETLILNEGQCSSTSTLFTYLLADDLDEVGYVQITSKDPLTRFYDGHTINYFKKNGKYYLICAQYYKGYSSDDEIAYLWKGEDTIDEIMERLYDSEYPNGKVTELYAFCFDGVFCLDPSRGTMVFPTGSEVKFSKGGSIKGYDTPKHPTSQDYIIGVETTTVH